MIAYYVHDPQKEIDVIVLPDMGCSILVTAERLTEFISVQPVFAKWSGDSCGNLAPEDFGTVIATREETGDVCVLDQDLWQACMDRFLGNRRQ